MATKRSTKKETPVVKPEPVAPPIVGPKKVKVTAEELQVLQAAGRLVGYDPATCEATIK
jgi:hypothetical protein